MTVLRQGIQPSASDLYNFQLVSSANGAPAFLNIMTSQTEMAIPPTLKWRPMPVPLDAGLDKSVPTKLVDVNEKNHFPCRVCLKYGKPGEKMLLLSYNPWLGDSPYRQSGPIYVHEQPKCELADKVTAMPEQQRRGLLSVRAFDQDHMMKGCGVFEGTDLLQRAGEYFKNQEVEYLHVHNALPGCFAVRIDRGEQSS